MPIDNFELPPVSSETQTILQRALDALDDASRLSASLDQQLRAVAAARARHDAAAKALAEREADLALVVDEHASIALEQDLQALAGVASEAQADVARQQRIETAMRSRLAAAEDVVASERLALEASVREFAGDVRRAVGDHVAATVQPLAEALRTALVLSSATGSSLAIRLTEMDLPDVRHNGHLLHGLTLSAYQDGLRIPLSDAGGDPALVALAAKAAEPRLALQRLASYRPRAAMRVEA